MMHAFKPICFSLICSLFGACASKAPLPPAPKSTDNSASNSLKTASVIVGFQNERGSVQVVLDPNDEDLYLDFKASKKPDSKSKKDSLLAAMQAAMAGETELGTKSRSSRVQTDTVVKTDTVRADSLMWKDLKGVEAKDAQKAIALIQKAQERVYKKDYDSAKDYLSQSLKILPTPEAFALMGTISYVQQNKLGAKYYWQKSLELDANQTKVKKALEGLGGE